MPGKLDEETRDKLFEMLDDGESPADIADELDVSEKTVYNYKDEWEERNKIRERVSRNSGVSSDDVVQKAENIPGLGNQTAEALKQALSMNDAVLQDPNELYRLVNQVTELDAYWIDFLVKSVYPNMDAPTNPQQGGGQPQYNSVGQPNQQGGQQGPPRQYPTPNQNQQQGFGQQGQRGPGPQGQQYPPQQQQGGYQQQPSQRQGGGEVKDPRVDQLQNSVEQLTDAVSQLMEDDEDEGETEYIEIQQDDGSTLRLPADDPRVTELLTDDDDEDDMFDTLAKLKEAGLIMSPQDMREMQEQDEGGKSEMAKAIEALGNQQMQAQQQMSQNFQQVLERLAEEEEEQDDDLTPQQVEEIIDDKLTKDETERLREEMDEKFDRVLQEVNDRRNMTPAEQDPEVVKADRELDFREKQLETLNENIQTLPGEVAMSIRDGLVPAMKELQSGGGNPLWSPPGGQGRGEPQYAPQQTQQADEQRRQQQATRREQQRRQQQQRERDEQGGYPSRQQEDEQQEQSQMAQEEPESATAQDAQAVREKLGLDDDEGEAAGVPAQ